MAFQKKGRSAWYVTVREPDTGRVITLKGDSRDDADAKALEYRAKKKRKSKEILPVVASSTPTFRERCTAHLRTLQPNTAKNELYLVNEVYLPILGNKPIDRITAKDLKKIVEKLESKGNKPNTIKRRFNLIRAILNKAVADGLIGSAPVLKVPSGKDAVVMPPTKAEIRRLLDQAAPHIKRAIILAAHTGLRAGRRELLAVTWDNVDFDDEAIRVVSAKKGGLPWRNIPISPDLLPLLKRWHEEDLGHGHIVNYRGKPVGDVKKAWAATKERAGITRRLRMYDLRHAFVTDIMSGGVDLTTAAYLAGHADPRTTAKVYRHVKESDTQNAVKQIGKITDVEDYGADYKCPKSNARDYKHKQ